MKYKKTEDQNEFEKLETKLTSRGTDRKPFWNSEVKETSDHLWFPPFSEGIINEQNSLFSIDINGSDEEETTELNIPQQVHHDGLKVKKFRLFPTENQKNILNMWFGAYRWCYNEAKEINMRYHERYHKRRFRRRKSSGRKYLSFMSIKKKMRAVRKWSTKVIPDRIMTGAIQDYASNFKTCCTLVKNGNIKYFDIKDKRKKGLTQTLNLEKACFGLKNVLFPKYELPKNSKDPRDKKIKRGLNLYGVYKTKHKLEKLKDTKIDHDCRMSYKNGRFFLLVPYEKKEEQSFPEHKVISIDSGIRTFQTGYCPEGHTVEICKNVKMKLKKDHDKIDILNRVFRETRDRKIRKIISSKRRRSFQRIENKINDLHWKTVKFLTENYENIIISDFKTGKILRGNDICRSVKRSLSALSHYKFRRRLLEKCEARGNNLFVIDEAFTSKTCGRCGRINQNLGANKTFVCAHCNYKVDRDINASRNMLLKFLSSATGG
jgi:IS605 OrfB family transposase